MWRQAIGNSIQLLCRAGTSRLYVSMYSVLCFANTILNQINIKGHFPNYFGKIYQNSKANIHRHSPFEWSDPFCNVWPYTDGAGVYQNSKVATAYSMYSGLHIARGVLYRVLAVLHIFRLVYIDTYVLSTYTSQPVLDEQNQNQ